MPKPEKKNTHYEITYRDLKHFNEDLYLHDLFHAPFQKVEESNEVNDAVDIFYNILESVLNGHAKIVTKRVKTQAKPAWLSPEINEARHKRDYFHKKKNFDSFKFWRNRVTELIRKAKENYYSVAVENNRNTGDIWRCIKQLIPKGSHSIPNLLTDGTNIAETKTDVANLFNKFYTELSSNIFNCETDDPVNTFNALKEFTESKISKTEPFIINAITELEVFQMLITLNVNKSAGVDTIGPHILKLSANIISKPIAHMINLSIATGKFPEKLKVAKVTPIYKKGDKSDPGNYRPISILPTISKLFERHVTSQIYNYLLDYDLLANEQSGFRKMHSCQTALTKLTEKWISDIDNGNVTGAVLLDFRKAFDLVNHEVLLNKLRYYNFEDKSLSWLQSYLSNRTQTVHIGNTHSNPAPISCGVPQGSVLGPVLFLLFINDLPLHVKNSLLDLFADDDTLHNSEGTLCEIENNLREDIEYIDTWCTENRMVINEKKTKCMLIGSRQRLARLPDPTLNIQINGQLIDNINDDKLLGMRVDNTLQFNKHVDDVCKAISNKLNLLRKIKKYLGHHHRVLYYNAYILPSIDYCLTIYGNASKSHLDRIFKLQKCAARIILDAPPDAPSKPLFVKLNWLNVFERCTLYNYRLLMRSTHDHEDRVRYWLTDAEGGGQPIPDKVFMVMSRPKSKVYYCFIKLSGIFLHKD